MASFDVTRHKVFPAGNRIWEVLSLSSGTGANSTAVALDFRSALRYIEPGGVQIGKDGLVAQLGTAAITWSNATFPGNALVTLSGMSTTGADKKFSLVLVGRR